MLVRVVISGVLAAGLIGLVTTSSQAQQSESGYAVLGKWTVTAVWAGPNVFGYCAATINNGKANFRIGTNGRSWQVGTQFFGKTGKVSAYYGFGMAAEVAQLSAEGDGWASMPIGADQLTAFRQSPSFSLNIGKNEQTWDLRGAGAAIDKARECASRKGATQKVATPTAPSPAKMSDEAFCRNVYGPELMRLWASAQQRGCRDYVNRNNNLHGHVSWCLARPRAQTERALAGNRSAVPACL